jgi:tetratricopeptide (TPR) repeat protein
MVKHQAYFDFLAGSDAGAPEWQPVLAGLATLRLIDARIDVHESHRQRDWASFESVRHVVTAVNVGDPVRATLLRLIETVNQENIPREDVGQALLSYGRALNFAGRWALACDAFASADRIAGAPLIPRLSVEASIAHGAAARKLGDWSASADAYARAAHIANTVGDSAGALQVDVGLANNHMARGNLPAAESLLDNVVEKARAGGFDEVLGLALHSRGAVAHLKGGYADAVRFGHEALQATRNLTARDGILSDIAGSFASLGMREAARDGYLIVAVTAQSQWVRWQATLNLMELAAIDGREADFDSYARELEIAPLAPRLRAYYYIFLGAGQQKFGRNAEAEASLAEGLEFAQQNQLHQIAHEAQAEIAALDSRAGAHAEHPVTAVKTEMPSNVRDVAAALSDLLREAAASSP